MRSDACLTSGRSIQPAAAGHGLARKPAPPGRLLSPRPLVGFGWRGFLRRTLGRGLRVWGWLQRRVEPRQRRAQRIKARGARKSVRLDGMSDCCGYGGELVVGEVNRRHGGLSVPSASPRCADQLRKRFVRIRSERSEFLGLRKRRCGRRRFARSDILAGTLERAPGIYAKAVQIRTATQTPPPLDRAPT